MRRTILATTLLTMSVCASVASAGPLNPSLAIDAAGNFTSVFAGTCLGFSCIAGEGAAVNTLIGKDNPTTAAKDTVPDTAIQHLDWIVVHDGNVNGGYTYYYQLENSSIAALGGHTINTPDLAAPFFAPFILAALDLDLDNATTGSGHSVANFLNLLAARTSLLVGPQNGAGKPEFEFAVQKALVGPSTNVVDFNGDLLVTFATGLAVNSESGVYGAQGTRPVYGPWNTQGAAFTWNSENENPCTGPVGKGCEQGIRVPVPGIVVPEPASLLLFASGLLGLGAWTRRRRQKN